MKHSLITTAAVLLASTSLALAQKPASEPGGQTPQAQTPAKQGAPAKQHRGTSTKSMGQTAQEPRGKEQRLEPGRHGQSAQERERGKGQRLEPSRKGQSAQEYERGQPGSRPQRGERRNPVMQGQKQSPSAREPERLSGSDRTRIRESVLRGHPNRVPRVDFDVHVGVRVPHAVHLVQVPPAVVEIEPRYRGYLYFVYEDEIVIVSPRTMEIVAVIPA